MIFACRHPADLTERRIQECLKIGVKAKFAATSFQDGNAHVNYDNCGNVTTKSHGMLPPLSVFGYKEYSDNAVIISLFHHHAGNTHGKAVVDKVLTSVKGGSLESAVTMRAKLNKEGVMDIDTYQNWARTVSDAPALLSSEVGTMAMPQDLFFLTECQRGACRTATVCFVVNHRQQ